MVSESESPNKPMTPLNQMLQNVFSDNSNIMLAAIISLLLVILFVLLLHVYAKWFLAQAQGQALASRRRRRRSVTVSDVLGPSRFHHFTIEDASISSSPTKGLDSVIVAAIPLFLYEETEEKEKQSRDEHELECVICLSSFENGEIGRCLPKCRHCFHVECIDMWLGSHSNCPICRAPIVGGIVESDSQLDSPNGNDSSSSALEIVIDSPSSEVSENENGNGNDSNGSVNFSSSISMLETSSTLLGMGCTLKRVLSKVFPSSNVNELDA
ncbi:hypothetical protein L6164_026032 [Bauhinia variegata]|uniref:Uncharacterized protein n=1 Tax=Bauhinia variegata TaxID=167791 RepID=A0ACB9M4D4_BAUVA|nr:hypothetical protein L6164_026032 [Bauhinia variegata]